MFADEVDYPAFNMWPNRVLVRLGIIEDFCMRIAGNRRSGCRQVLDGDNNADLDDLLARRIDDLDG